MDIELNGKDFPNIFSYLNNGNPTLRSPSSVYEISLMQTKETLADIDSSLCSRNLEVYYEQGSYDDERNDKHDQ